MARVVLEQSQLVSPAEHLDVGLKRLLLERRRGLGNPKLPFVEQLLREVSALLLCAVLERTYLVHEPVIFKSLLVLGDLNDGGQHHSGV